MNRNLRWIALALLAGLVLAGPCFAESMSAPAASSMKAQASLDFRIVIPETVDMHSREDHIGRVRRFVSQTIEVRGDRKLVTIAKP